MNKEFERKMWIKGARQLLRELRWEGEFNHERVRVARQWLVNKKIWCVDDDDSWAAGYLAMLKKKSVS